MGFFGMLLICLFTLSLSASVYLDSFFLVNTNLCFFFANPNLVKSAFCSMQFVLSQICQIVFWEACLQIVISWSKVHDYLWLLSESQKFVGKTKPNGLIGLFCMTLTNDSLITKEVSFSVSSFFDIMSIFWQATWIVGGIS
jgi:hypothetical protein